MLSMPAGTDARVLLQAASEFAKAELANHRYVMVLHTHQTNQHVHLSVRAEGRDGQRLNPRKEERETFVERLTGDLLKSWTLLSRTALLTLAVVVLMTWSSRRN